MTAAAITAGVNATALLSLLKGYFLSRADKVCFLAPWGSPCPTRGDYLLDALLLAHLLGDGVTPATAEWGPTQQGKQGKERGHFRIGTYTPALDGTTRFGVIDLDGGEDHGRPLRDPLGAARAVLVNCVRRGLPAYLEKSGSGRGWHLWFFFALDCKARDVRTLLLSLVPEGLPLKGKDAGTADAAKGIGVEVFPKSDSIGSDPWSVGAQVWLPWFYRAKGDCNQFHRLVPDGEPVPFVPAAFDLIDATALKTALGASGVAQDGPATGNRAQTPPDGPDAAGATLDGLELAELLSALEALPQEQCDGYQTWLAVGMALRDLAPELGTDGELFNVWRRWSRKSPRFEEGACARHWKSFGRRADGPRRTVASVFKVAREAGWCPPPVCNVIVPAAAQITNSINKNEAQTKSGTNNNGAQMTNAGSSNNTQTTTEITLVPDWPEPIPLLGPPPVPVLPTRLFPPWLRDFADATAVALSVPPDLPGMLALGVAGAGLARKYRVLVRDDYFEPLNLFVCVLLGVADRKTAALARVMRPVYDYERDADGRMALLIAQRNAQRDVLQALYREASALARTGPADQREANMAAAARALLDFNQVRIPTAPRVWTEDATPEAVARLLAEQNGRLLVASAEGTAFAIVRGRYGQGGPNFDVYLKGHAGDPIRVDRQGHETQTVHDPALSAAITMQPDVARQAAELIELRAQGFMARWLWIVPVSLVGSRPAAAPGVPATVTETYRKRMTDVWALEAPAQGAGDPLRLSSEADDELQRLAAWLEPQLGEGGDLRGVADWAGKLTGAAARVAGILHAAAMVGEGGALAGSVISGTTAAAAVELAQNYLLPHALAAFSGVMGASPRVRDALAVLRWLRANTANSANSAKGGEAPRLNKRTIFEGCKGRWPTVEQLDPVLELLAAHRYLYPLPRQDRPGPGRKPSQEYHINPRGLTPEGTAGGANP